MNTKISFIGLGSLGEPLAMNLVKAKYDVTVTDLKRENAARLEAAGAKWSDDIAGVCANADVVITALPSVAASRRVVEGENGVFDNLEAGSTWIEMSTTDVEIIQQQAEQAAARGIYALECPVTGGVHRAHSGRITVLVGGTEEDFKRVEPILSTMGGEIILVGPVGHAGVVKVVTNMLAFINLVSCGEAMMLCAKYGVDLDKAYQGILHSSGNSFVHETESKLVLSGSYQVDFTMDLALKDLGIARDIANKIDVPLELGAATEAIFKRARKLFGGEAQSPRVVQMLENICGIKLRADGYPEKLVELVEDDVQG